MFGFWQRQVGVVVSVFVCVCMFGRVCRLRHILPHSFGSNLSCHAVIMPTDKKAAKNNNKEWKFRAREKIIYWKWLCAGNRETLHNRRRRGDWPSRNWMAWSGSIIFVNDPLTSSDRDASIKNHYDLFEMPKKWLHWKNFYIIFIQKGVTMQFLSNIIH